MAAVIEPTGASATAGQQQTKRIRFGSVEPALLVVLKQLDPLVAVLCLIACVLVCRGPFTPGLGAVAVLTFVIASRVFGRASRDEEMAGARITTRAGTPIEVRGAMQSRICQTLRPRLIRPTGIAAGEHATGLGPGKRPSGNACFPT